MAQQYDPKGVIDPDLMSLQDLEELLEISGKENLEDAFSALSGGNIGKDDIKVMATLLQIAQRRVNPEFTIADAYALPLGVLKEAVAGITENPTET